MGIIPCLSCLWWLTAWLSFLEADMSFWRKSARKMKQKSGRAPTIWTDRWKVKGMLLLIKLSPTPKRSWISSTIKFNGTLTIIMLLRKCLKPCSKRSLSSRTSPFVTLNCKQFPSTVTNLSSFSPAPHLLARMAHSWWALPWVTRSQTQIYLLAAKSTMACLIVGTRLQSAVDMGAIKPHLEIIWTH